MWKFIVDVVHDFASSLQPDVGRGFLHVSNVFLLIISSQIIYDHMEIIQHQHLFIYLLIIYLSIYLFIYQSIYMASVQFLCVQ